MVVLRGYCLLRISIQRYLGYTAHQTLTTAPPTWATRGEHSSIQLQSNFSLLAMLRIVCPYQYYVMLLYICFPHLPSPCRSDIVIHLSAINAPYIPLPYRFRPADLNTTISPFVRRIRWIFGSSGSLPFRRSANIKRPGISAVSPSLHPANAVLLLVHASNFTIRF
jgi:hypothetical protein